MLLLSFAIEPFVLLSPNKIEPILPSTNNYPKRSEKEISTSSQQVTFQFHLKKGWNLISIPLSLSNYSVESVFGPIMEYIEEIWTYDASDPDDPWKLYRPGAPSFVNEITEIDLSLGYIVIVKEDVTLNITGEPISSFTFKLYVGWNLIGYPFLENRSISEFKEELGTDYNLIFSYYPENVEFPWKYYSPDEPDSELTELSPGLGYWVYVKDSDNDMLADMIEVTIGTDLHDPDTDDDGLQDGFEYYEPLLAANIIMSQSSVSATSSSTGSFAVPLNHSYYLVIYGNGEVTCPGNEAEAIISQAINITLISSDEQQIQYQSIDAYTYVIQGNPDSSDVIDNVIGFCIVVYYSYLTEGDYTLVLQVNSSVPYASSITLNLDMVNLQVSGALDPTKPDTDGDGLSDAHEIAHAISPVNPDTDSDGITDNDEIDSDGDGLSDGYELQIGSDPYLIDTDNDTLTDYYEIVANVAIHKDFYTDPTKPDTDGDGLPDAWELRYGYSEQEGKWVIHPCQYDTDGDGISDAYEDLDGDGLTNLEEYLIGKTLIYRFPLRPSSYLDAIKYSMGVYSDPLWFSGLLDPQNSDTDDDGLSDMYEGLVVFRTSVPEGARRFSNYLSATTNDWAFLDLNPYDDNTGIKFKFSSIVQNPSAGTEYDINYNNIIIVFELEDGSYVAYNKNYNRLYVYMRYSELTDADGDGILNATIAVFVYSASVPAVTTNRPQANYLGREYYGPSLAYIQDSDDDGVLDGDEIEPLNDTDNDGLLNIVDIDSDNDGIIDGYEILLGTSPVSVDSDEDGIPDNIENQNLNFVVEPGEMNPLLNDTDNDGIPDRFEDINGNGIWDPGIGETNPVDPDTDDDGLTDLEEIKVYFRTNATKFYHYAMPNTWIAIDIGYSLLKGYTFEKKAYVVYDSNRVLGITPEYYPYMFINEWKVAIIPDDYMFLEDNKTYLAYIYTPIDDINITYLIPVPLPNFVGEEMQALGTDPLDPDTDDDGLIDSEVQRIIFRTNADDVDRDGTVDYLSTDNLDSWIVVVKDFDMSTTRNFFGVINSYGRVDYITINDSEKSDGKKITETPEGYDVCIFTNASGVYKIVSIKDSQGNVASQVSIKDIEWHPSGLSAYILGKYNDPIFGQIWVLWEFDARTGNLQEKLILSDSYAPYTAIEVTSNGESLVILGNRYLIFVEIDNFDTSVVDTSLKAQWYDVIWISSERYGYIVGSDGIYNYILKFSYISLKPIAVDIVEVKEWSASDGEAKHIEWCQYCYEAIIAYGDTISLFDPLSNNLTSFETFGAEIIDLVMFYGSQVLVVCQTNAYLYDFAERLIKKAYTPSKYEIFICGDQREMLRVHSPAILLAGNQSLYIIKSDTTMESICGSSESVAIGWHPYDKAALVIFSSNICMYTQHDEFLMIDIPGEVNPVYMTADSDITSQEASSAYKNIFPSIAYSKTHYERVIFRTNATDINGDGIIDYASISNWNTWVAVPISGVKLVGYGRVDGTEISDDDLAQEKPIYITSTPEGYNVYLIYRFAYEEQISVSANDVAWRRSPYWDIAFIACNDGVVIMYNATRDTFSTFTFDSSVDFYGVTWSYDGQYAIIVGSSNTILLYDIIAKSFKLYNSSNLTQFAGVTWYDIVWHDPTQLNPSTFGYIVGYKASTQQIVVANVTIDESDNLALTSLWYYSSIYPAKRATVPVTETIYSFAMVNDNELILWWDDDGDYYEVINITSLAEEKWYMDPILHGCYAPDDYVILIPTSEGIVIEVDTTLISPGWYTTDILTDYLIVPGYYPLYDCVWTMGLYSTYPYCICVGGAGSEAVAFVPSKEIPSDNWTVTFTDCGVLKALAWNAKMGYCLAVGSGKIVKLYGEFDAIVIDIPEDNNPVYMRGQGSWNIISPEASAAETSLVPTNTYKDSETVTLYIISRETIQEGTDPLNPDTDGDRLTDYEEYIFLGWNDTDGDGLINPLDIDSDGDLIPDSEEFRWNIDSDADGLPNALDINSDLNPNNMTYGDLYNDTVEVLVVFRDLSPYAGEGKIGVYVGGSTLTGYIYSGTLTGIDFSSLIPITYTYKIEGEQKVEQIHTPDGRLLYYYIDNDPTQGIIIKINDTAGELYLPDRNVPSEYLVRDLLSKFAKEFLETYNASSTVIGADTDHDGLVDGAEYVAGTDYTDPDSDDDGLADGREAFWNFDIDNDGLINALDIDSDNDGIPDGWIDGWVFNTTTWSGYVNDSLKDGIKQPWEGEDLDLDGVQDPNESCMYLNDTDGDGLLDGYTKVVNGKIYLGELSIGGNNTLVDTDGDGVNDGIEAYTFFIYDHLYTDDVAIFKPNEAAEYKFTIILEEHGYYNITLHAFYVATTVITGNPGYSLFTFTISNESESSIYTETFEISGEEWYADLHTSTIELGPGVYKITLSSNGQIADGVELIISDIVIYKLGSNVSCVDSDGDGLTDYDEIHGTQGYYTSPISRDTDVDLIDDDDEISAGLDPCELDTDGDGIWDGWDLRADQGADQYNLYWSYMIPAGLLRFTRKFKVVYVVGASKGAYGSLTAECYILHEIRSTLEGTGYDVGPLTDEELQALASNNTQFNFACISSVGLQNLMQQKCIKPQ